MATALTDPIQKFDEATILQFAWKTESMVTMAVAVTKLALQGGEFAADDLPDELVHGGQGICGSVFAALETQGIIGRVGLWQGTEFYPKRRKSKHPKRNG